MEPDSRFFPTQLSDLFFKPPKPGPQGGRPRADARACLEGVLWVLRSGAREKTCRLGSPRTPPAGVGSSNERLTVRSLRQKKGDSVGLTKRGKGTKFIVFTDAQGLPLVTDVERANFAEVNLIEPLLDEAVTDHVPARLVYEKAADCDALRDRLAERSVDLICLHRRNRVRKKKQDGRKLRRYRRRWTVDRSIACLRAFKRLVVRDEFYAHLYHGFVKLACMSVCFRRS